MSFVPVFENDVSGICALSETIWREHYPGIIALGQIEYMLERMYSEATLREEIRSGHNFEVFRSGGRDVGYLSYRLEDDAQVKLTKIYLLRECRGVGLGRLMLQRVVDAATSLQAREIFLYVNKRNVPAIAAYERFGFTRAEAVITDIGGGFVMDDWVMRFLCPPPM